jgi:hypothetical protein
MPEPLPVASIEREPNDWELVGTFNSIEELMQAPVYQRSFDTQDIIPENPDEPYRHIDRYGTPDERRVYFAALKIDHLIRNCLVMQPHRANFDGEILCAIKAFLRHLELTLPQKQIQVNSVAKRAIRLRIAFCRAIVVVCDRICQQENVPEFRAEYFEDLVRRCGGTMDEAVYGNPFWVRYNGGGVGSDGRRLLRPFDIASSKMVEYQSWMKQYWS